jgi:uncharacterized protein HemX
MADQRSPHDPFSAGLRPDATDSGRPSRLETDAQIDPELSEGPASNGKIALFAIAIALVLGAVFYGLNNSNVHQASTAPTASPASTAQTQPAPNNAASNAGQGVTTGSATTRPTEPQSSPKGSEVDRANSNAK